MFTTFGPEMIDEEWEKMLHDLEETTKLPMTDEERKQILPDTEPLTKRDPTDEEWAHLDRQTAMPDLTDDEKWEQLFRDTDIFGGLTKAIYDVGQDSGTKAWPRRKLTVSLPQDPQDEPSLPPLHVVGPAPNSTELHGSSKRSFSESFTAYLQQATNTLIAQHDFDRGSMEHTASPNNILPDPYMSTQCTLGPKDIPPNPYMPTSGTVAQQYAPQLGFLSSNPPLQRAQISHAVAEQNATVPSLFGDGSAPQFQFLSQTASVGLPQPHSSFPAQAAPPESPQAQPGILQRDEILQDCYSWLPSQLRADMHSNVSKAWDYLLKRTGNPVTNQRARQTLLAMTRYVRAEEKKRQNRREERKKELRDKVFPELSRMLRFKDEHQGNPGALAYIGQLIGKLWNGLTPEERSTIDGWVTEIRAAKKENRPADLS
jgi:hypothetical protein